MKDKELIQQIKSNANRIRSLKKEVKKLEREKNYYKSEIFKSCLLCGKTPVTNHSPSGKHKKPFVPLCRKCHDNIEIYKHIKKTLNTLIKLHNKLDEK